MTLPLNSTFTRLKGKNYKYTAGAAIPVLNIIFIAGHWKHLLFQQQHKNPVVCFSQYVYLRNDNKSRDSCTSGSQASLLWCIFFLRPAPCVQRLRYNHRKHIHGRFCFILKQSWRVYYGESYYENCTTLLQVDKNFLQQSKQLRIQVHRMLRGYRWGPLRKLKYKGEVLILSTCSLIFTVLW